MTWYLSDTAGARCAEAESGRQIDTFPTCGEPIQLYVDRGSSLIDGSPESSVPRDLPLYRQWLTAHLRVIQQIHYL
jgi:hypothetical protein